MAANTIHTVPLTENVAAHLSGLNQLDDILGETSHIYERTDHVSANTNYGTPYDENGAANSSMTNQLRDTGDTFGIRSLSEANLPEPSPDAFASIMDQYLRDHSCPSEKLDELWESQRKHTFSQKLSSLPTWIFDRTDWDNTPAHTPGLTDKQWNVYLTKIGFLPILNNKALLKGDTVVVKAGVFRCWVSVGATAKGKALKDAINRMAKAHRISLRQNQFSQLRKLHRSGYTLIFPITREFVCNMWMGKYFKGGKTQKFPRKNVKYDKRLNRHMGILVVTGQHWKYIDCNNTPGQEKHWVRNYYKEIKQKFVKPLADENAEFKKIACGIGSLEFVPTWDSYRLINCHTHFCLFAVEQLQKKHPNFILNNTVAQSILYFEKVKHFVGGNTSFEEYEAKNPDWKERDDGSFPYERILQSFVRENGEIDTTMEEVYRIMKRTQVSQDLSTPRQHVFYPTNIDIKNQKKYYGLPEDNSDVECDDY